MKKQGLQFETPHNFATPAADNHLMSIEAVASTCGVSTRTVRRWIEKENLPVHHLPGVGLRGIVRIAQIDLDRWLERHRHDPETDATRDQTMHMEGMRFMKSSPSEYAPFARKNTKSSLISAAHIGDV